METIDTRIALQNKIHQLKQQNKSIGFVPTMGFLHDGHLSLMDEARKICDEVVVSIFVNPLQFGPNEDFSSYPRALERDLELCTARGVDLVFAPQAEELIPQETLVVLNVNQLGSNLCGKSRPNHFQGMCTIVNKLFNLVQPDYAFFGQKDIQQFKIIERMVNDLFIPVKLKMVKTIRASDGLALSSRNKYLSPEQRQQALIVPQVIEFIINQIVELRKSQSQLTQEQYDTLLNQAKEMVTRIADAHVDYLEIVSSDNLQYTENIAQELIIAAAIFIGSTRLIDNHILAS
ncbi:MAG: pantoate--beta-alanine ligase [Burkholderiales bacterium]|nr:pantoate--beta-alanine ligase [Burkholderiales bacterium]